MRSPLRIVAGSQPIRYSTPVPRTDRAALAALLAAFAVVLSIRWWLPLDERIYLWMQFHRTCRLDAWARWIDPVVRGTLVALILCAIVRPDWWQPRRLVGLVVLFFAGAGIVEFLKTATDRLRPNSTPAMMTGNSFPSGHTTGATMAAGIAVLLVYGRNWPPAARWSAYAIAVACVLLQGAGRVVNGSHWLSDVVVSILLGVAWVFGAQAINRLPRALVAGVVTLALFAFMIFIDSPGARVRLPSALDESRPSLAAIEFGTTEVRDDLAGSWEHGPAEPIGPVSWALTQDVSAKLRTTASHDDAILKLTLRPMTDAERRRPCSRVVVSVNEWVAPEITLVRGWREYHLRPPPGTIRPGDNTVRFKIVAEAGREDSARGLAAFRYLRLYPQA